MQITLADGTERKCIEDGDTITMSGVCANADVPYRVGFGECEGTILPARPFEQSHESN
eukprot:SAG11_NODE_4306_length_1958_cov_1.395374_1_plen_58_part_00